MRNRELGLVVRVIEKSVFTIADFKITNEERYTYVVYVRNPALVFTFDKHPGEFHLFTYSFAQYKPKYPIVEKKSKYIHLTDVNSNFANWLNNVVGEYVIEENLPDPITEAHKRLRTTLNDLHDDDTTSFTEIEKENYVKAIDSFQLLIKEHFEIPEDVKESVDKEFSYLKGSLPRLNKRDFKAVAKKIIYDIGISVTANVIMEATKALINTVSVSPNYFRLFELAFKIVEAANK